MKGKEGVDFCAVKAVEVTKETQAIGASGSHVRPCLCETHPNLPRIHCLPVAFFKLEIRLL